MPWLCHQSPTLVSLLCLPCHLLHSKVTPVTSQICLLPTHLQKEQEEVGVLSFMRLQFPTDVVTAKQVYSKAFLAVFCFVVCLSLLHLRPELNCPGSSCAVPLPLRGKIGMWNLWTILARVMAPPELWPFVNVVWVSQHEDDPLWLTSRNLRHPVVHIWCRLVRLSK